MHRVELNLDYFYSGKKKKDWGQFYDKTLAWGKKKNTLEIMYDVPRLLWNFNVHTY